MKTKIKVETIVQPLYKVSIAKSTYNYDSWFFCNANSIEEALKLAKEKNPNHNIGYAFECVDNWGLS